jgi:hypothetical protein
MIKDRRNIILVRFLFSLTNDSSVYFRDSMQTVINVLLKSKCDPSSFINNKFFANLKLPCHFERAVFATMAVASGVNFKQPNLG